MSKLRLSPLHLLLSLGVLAACSGKAEDSGSSTTVDPGTDCEDDDGDAICNDVDICPGSPDQADFDGDGTPDGCDGCPLDASGTDGDADGDDVCDSSDVCDGFPDDHDYDEDGVPNGCDDCGDDASDSVDTDGDGICNAADICDGFDDTIDTDADLVPDGCDPCPLDVVDDTDGDGVCDSDDICFGTDSTGDDDADGECNDFEPLAPPTDLVASASGLDVTVSWTPNPSSYTGVTVVARQYLNVVDGVPEDRVRVNVGDPIGTMGEIVYVGNDSTFTDAGLDEGAAFYQAWTVSSGGRVGDWGSRSWSKIDSGVAQTGSLSVDLGSGAVTFGTTPSHYTLTGSAVVDVSGTGTAEVTVDMTSLLARRVFHPKLSVSALGAGDVTGDATLEGDPVVWFGPEAMKPGVAVSRTFTITNLDGSTDPVVLDFEILDHMGAVVPEDPSDPARFVDLSGSGLDHEIDTDAIGFKRGNGQLTRGIMREDGAVVYGGARNTPVVAMLDMDTMTISEALSLEDYGCVPVVIESPNRRWLYATYAETHLYDGGDDDPAMYLVRIDRDTMTEDARVELLGDFDGDAVPRNMGISADGSVVSIIIRDDGRLYVVDTETMTVVDGDPASTDWNGFDLESGGLLNRNIPNAVALSDDGATAYVGYRSGSEVDVIDLASWTVGTPWTHPGASTTYLYTAEVLMADDGRLHWTSQNGGLVTFDASGTATLQTPDIGGDWIGAHFGLDGTTLYLRQDVGSWGAIWGFDTLTDTWLDLDGDTTDGTAGPAPQSRGDDAHLLVTTPF